MPENPHGTQRQANAYYNLKAGDRVVVRWGSNGSQKARVVGRTSTGRVKVQKYRANSRRWTKPTTIRVSELIGW